MPRGGEMARSTSGEFLWEGLGMVGTFFSSNQPLHISHVRLPDTLDITAQTSPPRQLHSETSPGPGFHRGDLAKCSMPWREQLGANGPRCVGRGEFHSRGGASGAIGRPSLHDYRTVRAWCARGVCRGGRSIGYAVDAYWGRGGGEYPVPATRMASTRRRDGYAGVDVTGLAAIIRGLPDRQ